MKSLALFSNKAGVGKTKLAFNMAHVLARRGHRTVVLDFDPQCSLSAAFLSDDELAAIWQADEESQPGDEAAEGRTVVGCIDLLCQGKGDLRTPALVPVAENLWLLPGHLRLSRFERQFAEEWPRIAAFHNERALDVSTSLDMLANEAAEQVDAEVVIIDVDSSLGALSRAALLACDAVIVSAVADVFSLQSMADVGVSLDEWRQEWDGVCRTRLRGTYQELLPIHRFQPIGYTVLRDVERAPEESSRWESRIARSYHAHVLGASEPISATVDGDEQCLALLTEFTGMIPLVRVARKPIIDLHEFDGLDESQAQAASRAQRELEELVERVVARLEEVQEATFAADMIEAERE